MIARYTQSPMTMNELIACGCSSFDPAPKVVQQLPLLWMRFWFHKMRWLGSLQRDLCLDLT